MSSTPTATFGLLLPAVGLRCLVAAAILGCGPGAGLAYGPRWGIFVSGSGDGVMAPCGNCSVAAHRRPAGDQRSDGGPEGGGRAGAGRSQLAAVACSLHAESPGHGAEECAADGRRPGADDLC